MCLATRKIKTKVDDFGNHVPSTATAGDIHPTSIGDTFQATDSVVIALPSWIHPLSQVSVTVTTIFSSPPQLRKKWLTRALGQVLQLPNMLAIIAVSRRISKTTQSSMDEALEEATRANTTSRKKVVPLLNSMIFDTKPFFVSFRPRPIVQYAFLGS